MKLLSANLQAFFAVATYQTVHAAAQHLHLTQTAVTQRIKMLETQLTTCLFVRSRQGMQLTAEGEALLQYCKKAHELEGEVLSAFKQVGREKKIYLHISGPATMMQTRIMPLCLPVLQIYPSLYLQFDIKDDDTQLLLLQRGITHLAIIEKQQVTTEFASKPLAPEQYLLVAAKAWEKRRLQDILQNECIIDFDAQDQMTFHYLKKFNLFNHFHTERHFANRTESVAYLIAQGLGYGVLPVDVAKDYLARGELVSLNDGKTYAYPYVLAWYPRPQMAGYFASIIAACK